MSQNIDVVTHIRAAAAHERAASGHEDKYANQMKAAGASMYAAFRAALLEQPDYRGRKIDERAIVRIYESPKPRPWWDAYLIEARFADENGKAKRDAAARLIQWHLDPEQAVRRRAQHQLRATIQQKAVQDRKVRESRGAGVRHESAPRTEEMRALSAGAEREEENAADVTLEDLLGEVARLQVAAKKVEAAHRGDALAAVRNAARELERYVP